METEKEVVQEKSSSNSNSNSKRMSVKIVVLGIVLVVCLVVGVLVAGSAYAFTSNKNVPVFSSLVETTENLVLTDTQTAEIIQQDIKDSVFSLILDMKKGETEDSSIKIEATEEEISSFIEETHEFDSARFEGKLVSTSTSTTTVNFDGFFNSNGLDMNYDGAFEMDGSDLVIGGELKYTEDKGYFKVDQFPTELLGIPELDALKGQWIVITGEDLSNPASLGSLGLSGSASVTSDPITKEDLDNLAEFIDSKEVSDNIQRTEDIVIDGVRVNCFEMDLDKNDLIDLSLRSSEIAGQEATREDVAGAYENYEQVLISSCSGRTDGYVYKMGLEVKMQDSENGVTTTTLELNFSDYNNVSDAIEVPAKTIPLSTVMEQVLGPLFSSGLTGDATVPTNDTILADPNSLPTDINWEDYADK